MSTTEKRAWLRRMFSKPVFADEEQTRRAGVLYTILLPMCLLAVVFLVANLLTIRRWREIAVVLAFLAAAGGVLHLLQRGRVATASWLILGVMWLGITGPELIDHRYDLLPTSMIVVVMAGLLLGGRAAFLFAGSSSAVVIYLAMTTTTGPLAGGTDEAISQAVFVIAILVALAMLLHIINGNIHKALMRARRHANELETRTAELEEAQMALTATRDHALRANRVKSQFLANMSHEIRTPLNAVVGMSDLLRNTPLSEEQRELVGAIQHGSDALLVLISDILDFSEIENGELELEMRPFDPRQGTEAAVKLVAGQAEDAGLELVAEVDTEVPERVIGDVERFRQIMLHLLSNAIKFTERGKVELRVESRCLDGERRHELHVSVSDTGIGIPPDRIDGLFDAFTQLDSSNTRRYGGTGLGLALCRRLVELTGGRIWVESRLGQGSTFHVTIPCRSVARAQSAPVAFDSSLGERWPLRILIAEDNVVNQRMLALTLGRLGYKADMVSDGSQAVAAVGEKPYDVVLMDLHMPEMDGVTATQEIRGRDSGVEQPYIAAVTANVTPDDRSRCRLAGMDAFIAKPVQLEELVASLEAAFGRKAPTSDRPTT